MAEQMSMFVDDKHKLEDDSFQIVLNNTIDIKLGDIFVLGNHRIMCGDATKKEHVRKLMGGLEADMYLTDPPYNVAYEGSTNDKLTIMNDNMSDESFRKFLKGAFESADSVMKTGSAFYIFHADSEGYNFRGACRDNNWKVRQCLIWLKNSIVMGRQDYQWKHEPILYGWKEGSAHRWFNGRNQSTILEFNKPVRNELHPTIKPVEMYIYLMNNSSQEGDIILDNFAGSGTIIIAAEYAKRRGYAMELDPQYCNVIIQRWQRITGLKYEKLVE